MANLDTLVSRHFTTFTESDKQIYKTLLSHQDLAYQLTINELAHHSFTSKSSVLRFVKKLGFRGFSDFKYSIDWDKPKSQSNSANSIDLLNEVKLIETSLMPQKIQYFSTLVKEASLICLIATGEDQSIQMKNFARMLLKKGIMSSQLHLNPNSELTKLVLDKLTRQNLLIVFSAGGNSSMIKQYILPIIEKAIPVIAITAFSQNWLSEEAALTFSLNISRKDDRLFPYTSGLSHLLINLLIEQSDLADLQ